MYSPKIVGLLQALGLAAYVGMFALCVRTLAPMLQSRFPVDPNPILPITLFLLTFVTSALICSTIAFGYPVYLFFFQDKKTEAMQTVLWNIGWLIAALALFLISLFVF